MRAAMGYAILTPLEDADMTIFQIPPLSCSLNLYPACFYQNLCHYVLKPNVTIGVTLCRGANFNCCILKLELLYHIQGVSMCVVVQSCIIALFTH